MEQDALVVNIEVTGERTLPAQVVANLYDVIALNISRHAGFAKH
jgi:hypothetical protein